MELPETNKHVLEALYQEKKRFDSRGLEDYRELTVTYDVSKAAEGAARVKLGKTEMIVGVKLSLDKPYPDSPDKGNLLVSGDLLPLASAKFESGPPKFDAIELPRLVDRVIRESHVIELDKLVVKAGEKVWTVIIDVYPLNADGNLIDAAVIGAIAALKQAYIPGITDAGLPDYKHRSKHKVPLAKDMTPLSLTAYKFGTSIVLDPTAEEEECADVKINFGVSKQGKKHYIHSAQKTGAGTFSQKELEYIADLLPKTYDQLYERLKRFL